MSEGLGETDEQRINIQKLLPIMKLYRFLIILTNAKRNI